MYCKKCGKEIAYDAEYCNECLESAAATAAAEPSVVSAPTVTEGDRKTGFKKALIGMILGVIGMFITYIVTVFIAAFHMEILTKLESGSNYIVNEGFSIGVGVVCILFAIIGFALCIPAVIFGIQSILTFVKEAKAGRVKPIVTLIFGCVSVAASVIAAILAIVAIATSVVAVTTLLDYAATHNY